jgi:hypothetical protein
MSDPQFRQRQLDGLRLPHIAPVNALLDELSDPGGRGWVPYLAAAYGGVAVRVLCVLRDPGPKTNDENDKPAPAELEAGVEPLRRLLGILPRLRVVMLHGGSAQDGWKRLTRCILAWRPGSRSLPPTTPAARPSSARPEVRAQRMADLADAFARAARMLQEATPPDGT